MDAESLQKLTKDYLDTMANASEFIYVDEDAQIPLTQVYVMLEAIKTEPPKSKEKRDEIAPIEGRQERAGLKIPDKITDQTIKQPPVLLSKALAENNHIVLLGEPGAGKTTALNFIGLCFAKEDEHWAEEQLNIHEARIPIKLQLQVYGSDLANEGAQIIPALARRTASRLTIKQEKAEELVTNWLETGRLLILLDGLDEIYEKRGAVMNNIRLFAESPIGKQARIVITSRLEGYTSLAADFKEFTLKPLQKETEVKSFLYGWLISFRSEWKDEIEQKVEELLKGLQAQSAMKRLTNNPLILRMAAEQYANNKEIAHNRAHLYRAYVEVEAWQRAVNRGTPQDLKARDEALATLEALAWHLQMGRTADEDMTIKIFIDKKYALDIEESIDKSKAQYLLELVREKMGLVILVREQLVFSHTTFREYFVAKRLLRAWQKNAKLTWKFLQPRLHIAEWREPLLLLASGLDETEMIKLIIKISHSKSRYEYWLQRDFMLAATLIGENNVTRSEILEPYIRALKNSSEYALEALNKMGVHALPILIQGLKHKYYDVRWESVRGLSQIDDPQAFDALLQALKDEDSIVREEAVRALAKIDDPQAFDALLQALKDEDSIVRSEAARALGQIGNPQATPALLQALKEALKNEDDFFMRSGAVRALGQIGNSQAIKGLLQAYKEDHYVKSYVVEALGQIEDSQALPVLLQALKDEDQYVKSAVAKSLGQIGNPQAIEVLLHNIKDEDQYVRMEAVRALCQIKNPQTLLALLQALKEGDQHVKSVAAEALGQIGDPRAIEGLIQALKDETGNVRLKAVEAICQIGDSQVLPILLQALKDEDQYVRLTAVRLLAKIDDPQAFDALLQALKHESGNVRLEVAIVLRQINDPRAFDALLRALKDEDQYVRSRAARTLGQTGDPQAIPALLQALKDEDSFVRSRAVEALSQIQGPKALPVLLQALKDEGFFVKSEAIRALAKIGDPQIFPALFHALKDKDFIVRLEATKALHEIGNPQAIEGLFQALKDEAKEVRLEAAEALGQIGDPQAIEGLLQALKDEDEYVRSKATEALDQITQKWPISTNPIKRRAQIKTLNKVARVLLHGRILEQLENLTAPQFDPLNPPLPPKWIGSLKYAGYAFALMILLGIAALIAVALNSAQGTIKGFVEHWVQSQSVSVIIALFLTLPLLAMVIGITITNLKKKLEK